MNTNELLKGTLSAMILKMLSDHGRMYGYQMSIKVKELSGGKIQLKDGSLYPALQKLTSDGLLSFREEKVDGRIRKYYYLTKAGQKKTTAYIEQLREFISSVNKVVFPDVAL